MTRRRLLTGAGYIAVVLVALLLRYRPSYYAAQLLPLPDALEYAVTGVSLFSTGQFAMSINHVPYPPNYPFGFPLLLTPVFAILGPVAHNAVWASIFYSLALLVVAMFITQRLFGHSAALVTGLVIGAAKQQIVTSQEIMSDAASAALVLLAALSLLRAADGQARNRHAFGAGLAAGLVVCIRLGDAALAVALGLLVLITFRQSLRAAIGGLAAFALGGAPWAIALLTYNWQSFGSPFRTGYSYWNPFFDKTSSVFNLRYLIAPSAPDTLPTIRYYGAMLLGLDWWFYLPPFVMAIALGLLAVARHGTPHQKRGVAALGILSLANVGIYSVYNFQYPRFLMLACTVLTIIGAHGVVEMARVAVGTWGARLGRWIGGAQSPALFAGRRAQVVAAVVLALVVGGILIAGADAVRNSYIFRTQVRGVAWHEYPWRYEVVRFLDSRIPGNALIISALPGPYVEHYVIKDTQRMYVPIKHKGVFYAGKPPAQQWIVADEDPEFLEGEIRRGRSVYLLDDPLTAEQTAARDFLRARFVWREAGVLSMTIWGKPTKATLYQLLVREP
jgi:4-amino-4-deoxy-L-arabinose transferase-like glycosyltransferase